MLVEYIQPTQHTCGCNGSRCCVLMPPTPDDGAAVGAGLIVVPDASNTQAPGQGLINVTQQCATEQEPMCRMAMYMPDMHRHTSRMLHLG